MNKAERKKPGEFEKRLEEVRASAANIKEPPKGPGSPTQTPRLLATGRRRCATCWSRATRIPSPRQEGKQGRVVMLAYVWRVLMTRRLAIAVEKHNGRRCAYFERTSTPTSRSSWRGTTAPKCLVARGCVLQTCARPTWHQRRYEQQVAAAKPVTCPGPVAAICGPLQRN